MITNEKWTEVIKDLHMKGIPELIHRELNIPKEIKIRRAISIIGPRRAGKTYAMFQLIKSLFEDGIEMNRILYVNFERSDLEGCSPKDLQSMTNAMYEIYPESKKKKMWLFLDEIQNVEGWEKYVRTLIDNENVQVFISGSSSKLLSREVATSMRGRTITYKILPFSFEDFLKSQGVEKKKHISSSEKSRLINLLGIYMANGGYPEVIIYSEEKEKLLSEIVETTIYRDVIERYKIRNTKLLRFLIKSLISSSAKEFSVHKFFNLAKSMGFKASKNSLYSYVDALNDVFFAFLLRRMSYSYKDMEQSIPKVYLIDNGILTSNGIDDKGKLFENLIFIEMIRREKQVYYYKSATGNEVDFVVVNGRKVLELVQASYSMQDPDTKEREVKALIKASKDLKCKNLKIITWNEESTESISGMSIKTVPLWKWLMRG